MSRSRYYIMGVPVEVAERIYNIRKRRKLSRSEEPMETPHRLRPPIFLNLPRLAGGRIPLASGPEAQRDRKRERNV